MTTENLFGLARSPTHDLRENLRSERAVLALRDHPAIAEALELNEALANRHRGKAARRSPPAAAAASGLRGGLGHLDIGGRHLSLPLALPAKASTVERIVCANVSST